MAPREDTTGRMDPIMNPPPMKRGTRTNYSKGTIRSSTNAASRRHRRSPEHIFQRPEFSVKEKEKLIQVAKTNRDMLVQRVLHTDRDTLEPIDRIGKTKVYHEKAGKKTQCYTFLRSTCIIKTSIQQFATMFAPVRDQKRQSTRVPGILDTKILCELTSSTENKKAPWKYAGINWMMMATQNEDVRSRDFVLLQYQDLFRFDEGKRTGFVQSLHSIDLSFYPSLQEELEVVRGAIFQSGIVARETSHPGYIHVTYSLGINLRGDATRERALRVGWDRVAKLVHIERQVSKQYEDFSLVNGGNDLEEKPNVRRHSDEVLRREKLTQQQQQQDVDERTNRGLTMPELSPAKIYNSEAWI